ncbi:hypothetical protein [Variovorax sp. dw_308]|uniref:hypothetical protein n=1 Tax=Variovorax sp. dw_308 TaxID=2721546 RepID=UPI001C45A22B|nr:hypothetical protein [Variovorax sp. dw_308]
MAQPPSSINSPALGLAQRERDRIASSVGRIASRMAEIEALWRAGQHHPIFCMAMDLHAEHEALGFQRAALEVALHKRNQHLRHLASTTSVKESQ